MNPGAHLIIGVLIGIAMAVLVFIGWIRDLHEARDYWHKKYLDSEREKRNVN